MADLQVTCITPDGPDADARIDGIGGAGWYRTTPEAIRQLDTPFGERYFTNVNGRRANVIKATKNGKPHLKTDADGYGPNNLLKLPKCR